MTLQELFDLLANNPSIILTYFFFIPLTAVIAGILGKGEGHLSPWTYLYSTLIYLVCVPAIFAITLSIYLFLFERISIFETDVYSQIVPVLSMIFTLAIIKKNVVLGEVAGFGRLSGLLMIILVTLGFMWILDRTRIFVVAFTQMPFYFVLAIFAGLFLVLRIGYLRVSK